MDFILLTLGMVALIVGVLVLLARAYPGSGADLVDWRPTRSYEDEARLESEDIQQMIEAQNEIRRRRGKPDLTRVRCIANGARGRGDTRAPAPPYDERLDELEDELGRLTARRRRGRSVARALIVGCGCRGPGARAAAASRPAGRSAGRRATRGNAEDILELPASRRWSPTPTGSARSSTTSAT